MLAEAKFFLFLQEGNDVYAMNLPSTFFEKKTNLLGF